MSILTIRNGLLYYEASGRRAGVHKAESENDLATMWQTNGASGRYWVFKDKDSFEIYLCTSKPVYNGGGYYWADGCTPAEMLYYAMIPAALPSLRVEEGAVLVGVTCKTELEE